jgi:hypothetical protein
MSSEHNEETDNREHLLRRRKFESKYIGNKKRKKNYKK